MRGSGVRIPSAAPLFAGPFRTAGYAAPGHDSLCRRPRGDRHVSINFILLRFRLGLILLVEVFDRAFSQIAERQQHDADKARGAIRGLGEDRLRPALIPGGAWPIRVRPSARVDANAAFDQTADAGPLMPMQVSTASRRKRDA